MGNICKKVITIGTIFALGYAAAVYRQPIKEVASGVYDKTSTVAKQPFQKLYDWATDGKTEAAQPGELEDKLQENYQPCSK